MTNRFIYSDEDYDGLIFETEDVNKYRADQRRNAHGQFAPEGSGGSATVSAIPAGVNLDRPTYTPQEMQNLVDARRKYDNIEFEVKEEIKAANPEIANSYDGNRKIWDMALADPRVIAAREEYMSDPLLQRIRGFKTEYNGFKTVGEKADASIQFQIRDPETGRMVENPDYEHSPAGKEIPRLIELGDYYSGDPKDEPTLPNWDKNKQAYESGYRHMTREESFAAASQAVNEFLGESSPAIRINSTKLGPLLSDGRYKTSYETGKRLSTAGLMYEGYLDRRAVMENLWFGYDDNTPDSARPIYGFMRANNGNTPQFLQGYGDSEIILKPSVLSRTTLSIGDSLNGLSHTTPFKAGSNISPDYRNNNTIGQTAAAYKAGTGINYFSHPASEYTILETQFHGGVTLGDIDKIIIHRSDVPQTLLNRLDKAGISYEILPTEPPLPKD